MVVGATTWCPASSMWNCADPLFLRGFREKRPAERPVVCRRLAEEGPRVPGLLERRMLASCALDLAEHYAYSLKLGGAVHWLSRALIFDPVRSGLFVGYRILRSARRRFGQRVPIAEP